MKLSAILFCLSIVFNTVCAGREATEACERKVEKVEKVEKIRRDIYNVEFEKRRRGRRRQGRKTREFEHPKTREFDDDN